MIALSEYSGDIAPKEDGLYLCLAAEFDHICGGYGMPHWTVLEFDKRYGWNIKKMIRVEMWAKLPDIA